MRARIALACAGLFLFTGGALIAVTYVLVAHNLPPTVVSSGSVDPALLQRCKQNGIQDGNLIAKCKAAFSEGAAVGAKQQDRKSVV